MIKIAEHAAVVLAIMLALVLIAAGLIWLERRMLALWQDRYGPNRVGPFGTLQVVADMIKIFFKEDWIPRFADKKVFVVAPAIVLAATSAMGERQMLPVQTKTIVVGMPGTRESSVSRAGVRRIIRRTRRAGPS